MRASTMEVCLSTPSRRMQHIMPTAQHEARKKNKKHLRIHKHKATCQQVSWNKVIYWDSYPCEPKKHGHVTLSLTNKHWLMFGVNQEKLYVLEINQQA